MCSIFFIGALHLQARICVDANVVVKPSSNKVVLEALEMMRRADYHQGTNYNM